MSNKTKSEKAVDKVTTAGENENQKNVTSENVQNEKVASKKSKEESSLKSDAKPVERLVKIFNEHKKQVIIAGAIVAGLIVLLLVFNFVKSLTKGNNPEHPLVYLTKDEEFKFISSTKKEGTLIDDKGKKVEDVVYSKASDKYIMFIKDDDLYIFNTKKKDSAKKIASNVKSADFTENDKYVIFLDDDYNLYAYNFKDKEKLESNVDKIENITKDYVFYEKDDSLYMRSVKASKDDKKKIATDYSSVVFNEKNTKILIKKKSSAKKDDALKYTTFYDYSVYTIKSDKTDKVLEGVSGIYYNEDFTEFYYYEKSVKSNFDLSKIVDDDKLEEDDKFVEYTYDDYKDGKITYAQYYDNLDEKRDVKNRNEIREKIKNNDYTTDASYDLYYVKGSKKTEIATGVEEVLAVDFDSKTIAYSKVSYNTNNKIKMSEVRYFSDITSKLKKNKEYNIEFNIGAKNTYTLDEEIDDDIDVYIINKDIYYVLDNELFYTKANGKKLATPKSLGEKVSVINATGDYKNGLLFVDNYKYKVGDLKFAKGTKVTKIDSDVYTTSVKVTDNGKIYYLGNYDSSVGELKVYSGKAKTLVKDIGVFHYVKDNYIYVFKDYSSKSNAYDLYVYKGGKKLKLIDYSVVNVITK